MSVEQVVEPQWIYTCDYCKKNAQTDGSTPEGWSRFSFFGNNSLGDRLRNTNRDYCYNCTEKVMFYLKSLKGKDVEEDMWIRK